MNQETLCEKKKPRMVGIPTCQVRPDEVALCAPALPKLAAARPRVAHERPMAARRGHLAPTDRRQPPTRFRDAPTVHTCSSAHAQPGSPTCTTHCTLPSRTRARTSSSNTLAAATAAAAATAGTTATATAAALQAFAMYVNGSIQQLHFSSTCSGVEPSSSACQGRFVSFASVSHASFVRQSRQTRRSWQAATVSACAMYAMLCAVSVSLILALQWLSGQARQPRANPLRSVFAVVISDFTGTAASSIHLPHA